MQINNKQVTIYFLIISIIFEVFILDYIIAIVANMDLMRAKYPKYIPTIFEKIWSCPIERELEFDIFIRSLTAAFEIFTLDPIQNNFYW